MDDAPVRSGEIEAAEERGVSRTQRVASVRRARAGVDKREELLKAASRLFLKHGYDGGSINSLARSSGISKESIYRYFPSKEALFEAVLEKELETHKRALSTLAVSEGDATLETLQSAAENILTVMTSDRTLSLRRLMFQAATRKPEIGKHYYRIGPETAYAQFEEFFARMNSAGAFSPRELSRSFMALLLHEFMLARACRVESAPSRKRISEWAARSVDSFARSFLT